MYVPTETKSQAKEKTVVVLGKPRSGTSVTAGLLSILGVDMGANTSPSLFNPRGTYEDEDFDELNSSILRAAGGDDKVVLRPPSYQAIMAQKEKFDETIRDFFARKSKPQIWGWKKPATILLIELFVRYLTNPYIVVVLRNPVGTAESLIEHTKQWKHVTVLDMLKLANYFDNEIFAFLNRHPDLPRIFVAFEDVIGDPIGEAGRLADFLGLQLDDGKIGQIDRLIIPRNRIDVGKRVGFLRSIPTKSKTLIKKAYKEPARIGEYLIRSLRYFATMFLRHPKR